MKKTNKFVLIILSLVATGVFAHSGGRDSNGGHMDKKTSEYHCHTESCFNTQNKAETTGQTVTTKQNKSTKINIKAGDFSTHTTYNKKD